MSGCLHHLDPRSRLLGLAAFAVAVVLSTHLLALVGGVVVALVACTLAGVSWRLAVRRLLAIEGFAVIALISLPFTIPGPVLFTVSGWPVSLPGLLKASDILLRINGVTLMSLALLHGLEAVIIGQTLRRLAMPEKLVQLFLFTIRYFDVFQREYARLRAAMRARAFVIGFNRHSWRTLGWLVGMLMVRSVERSERVVAAMRCRGFTGRFPLLTPIGHFGVADVVFAAFGGGVTALILIF